jgi:hypothetical protein
MVEQAALLVGINDYGAGSNLRRLKYAEDDARLFAATLEEVFRFRTVTLLGEAASRAEVMRVLKGFGGEDDLDLFLFYFSGHGELLRGAGTHCLHCFGSEARDTIETLNLHEWSQRIRTDVPARQSLLVVDACRDEPYRDVQIRGAAGLDYSVVAALKAASGAARDIGVAARPARGRAHLQFSFLASGAGQVSYEDDALRHGIFTHALVETLRSQGRTRPLNEVRKAVGGWTYEWCRSRKLSPEQVPEWIEPSLPGDLFLGAAPSPARIVVEEVTGTLVVKCREEGAGLSIDGLFLQEVPDGKRLRIPLLEGRHAVRLEKGMRRFETTVEIAEDRETRLDVELPALGPELARLGAAPQRAWSSSGSRRGSSRWGRRARKPPATRSRCTGSGSAGDSGWGSIR